MFYLIGIGLWNEKSASLQAIEAIKKCETVFAETYTNRMEEGTILEISKLTGKKIVYLPRERVEEEKEIVAAAKKGDTALIVPGDAMMATTHVSLLLSCRKAGLETKVIHGTSIITAAIGAAGLQIYKFGRTTTLVSWSEKYRPTSTYDAIRENFDRGLHTMVLLDIVEGKPMEAKQALELLLEMEKAKKGKVFSEKTEIVLLSRIGGEEQKVSFGEIGKLMKNVKGAKMGEPPFCIIVPGKLHFLEQEFLAAFSS
ncbi:Diphthine synthase [Candidatus Gugararchaeum adminiculabundum]|nr:Diphthine synthase [Candidatus Gugararchaeum adminiculabundum]